MRIPRVRTGCEACRCTNIKEQKRPGRKSQRKDYEKETGRTFSTTVPETRNEGDVFEVSAQGGVGPKVGGGRVNTEGSGTEVGSEGQSGGLGIRVHGFL